MAPGSPPPCGKHPLDAAAGTHRAAHRVLHLVIVLVVLVNEAGKAAWSHLQGGSFGYWWVTISGFSVYDQSSGAFSLGLTLILLEILLEAVAALGAPRLAVGLHAVVGLGLAAICAADLALFVGAGGARVSLPLVLFALSERQYVLTVVRPWLHVLLGSAVGLAACVVTLGTLLVRLMRRIAPSRRTPWTLKLGLLAACSSALVAQGRGADGMCSDLLGQLSIDAVNLVRGTLFSESLTEVLSSHEVKQEEPSPHRPPLLLFHWEAGVENLLRPPVGNRSAAAPFLRSLVERGEAIAATGTAVMPMTLKAAWEALCGMPPALTSDFREQGSALRHECLPRVLARCCNYHSILAKTDTSLPDMPKRVFGFSEVIIAPENEELLERLRARLESLRSLDSQRPVFVYFYAGDSHAPYSADRVSDEERGLAAHPAEDVFLALHRRVDVVAQRLAGFWPPRPPPGAAWRPEHGLVVYFGDHGEILDSPDAPPHGNSLVPEVTRVLLAVEGRFFARKRRVATGPSLRRLADVFSTVAACMGLRTRGRLHVGRSLLDSGGHESLASFSFYRPTELAAVHVAAGSGGDAGDEVRSQIFARGRRGWQASGGPADAGDPGSLTERLQEALAAREEVNAIFTRSNVHAAWLMARLQAAARQAKAALRAAAALIFPALPAGR